MIFWFLWGAVVLTWLGSLWLTKTEFNGPAPALGAMAAVMWMAWILFAVLVAAAHGVTLAVRWIVQ